MPAGKAPDANGMQTGRTVFPGVLSRLVDVVSGVTCAVPEGIGRTAAVAVGWMASRAWCGERARLRETIGRVYHRLGRPLPRPIDAIVDRMFAHFALNVYELLRYPVLMSNELVDAFDLKGLEHLEAALALKRGVILAVPHLGNWELLGASIAHRGYPLHSFYLAQKEDEVGGLLDRFRVHSRIVLHDRDRGGVAALKALKKGELLGMIADQDGGNLGVYMDFLGHWVSMPAGIANWSLKTGAVVVPLFGLRNGLSRRYTGWFMPALAEPAGADHTQKAVARTVEIARWFESVILEHPEQYLWFYDRFKPRHEAYTARMKCAGVAMRRGGTAYAVGEPGIGDRG
ncbi:lysophospholipid acyltransferase family protein [Candidatus Ozemobacteraceae bacterium]|nr:lysophospholipid acyltransferase family protein [Candidatus Ozemobacteraceae bacterium]